MSSKSIIVVGDGWAALGAVGFLASAGIDVCWIAGSGARMLAPLACLERGPGVGIWAELSQKLGIECGELKEGSFIREFRNKAFREPGWTKAPTPESRKEVRDELLWEPERRFIGAFDVRWSRSLGEIEEDFRRVLLSGIFPNLKRIEGVPITGLKKEDDAIQGVILGSGAYVECSQLIYADRWSLLPGIEGMPKFLPFLRNREPIGVLQAMFEHEPPTGSGTLESFYASVHRESGEDIERHVWGYFFSAGNRSVWTLCLSAEQGEDNHEITKKLRRLKNALDKVFAGSGLLPEGKDFGSTVVEERVRFVEEVIFAQGTPPEEPFQVPQLAGALFLTDGYGPYWALNQVGSALGIQAKGSGSQTEDVNLTNS
jgi:hypothetical protein